MTYESGTNGFRFKVTEMLYIGVSVGSASLEGSRSIEVLLRDAKVYIRGCRGLSVRI